MAKILKVDRETCIGCGTCAVMAEKSFKMESNKAVAVNPSGDSEEKLKEAIEACPVSAISIIETE